MIEMDSSLFGVDTDAEATRLTAEVVAAEEEIRRLRATQVVALRRLDRLEVDALEGARSMADWLAATLDVSHQTAGRLLRVARSSQTDIEAEMADGALGVDRADLLCRLRELDGPEEVIEDSSSYSLGHLYGLVERLRRIDPQLESFEADHRYLVLQPNLDRSSYRLWGEAPATDGRIIEEALTRRESRFPSLADQSSGQRRLDALTSLCLDSLTATSQGESARAVTVAEVFVDAALAASTRGEAGGVVASGPRVGPNVLSEILCSGKIRVVFQGEDGRPIGVSDRGDAIPPAVRSFVLFRDQGRCQIDGCRSRYRLQPHHIVPRSQGGDHDPDNLITVCWYHHHVAIHMMGMTLDPESPPHRRRLQPVGNHDPPAP